MTRRPRIAVLYHYQRPDDVVSARQYDDLCEGLARRGWEVEALPSNRSCHDPSRAYPLREVWRDVTFRRIWRPPLVQGTAHGRLLNALWMATGWVAALSARLPSRRPDVVLLGTDPVLSVAIAPALKRLIPGVKVAHWVFDVYPEAAAADGLLDPSGLPYRALRRAVAKGYAACDLIADLGPRMREVLEQYPSPARRVTITPWALTEPAEPPAPDPAMRRELFGDAKLGLLYSGSFGRAHDGEPFLALARRLRGTGVHFCFAGRGHRSDALRAAVTPEDTNVSFAGFCEEAELERRLAAADVHMVSLRPEWSGLVVPSKFFGALACGRPVLYAGDPRSDLARWTRELEVGWGLGSEADVGQVADQLAQLAAATCEAGGGLAARCHAHYASSFSREHGVTEWDAALRTVPGVV